jgi:hypothetical protein
MIRWTGACSTACEILRCCVWLQYFSCMKCNLCVSLRWSKILSCMGKNIPWRTDIEGLSGGLYRKLDYFCNFTGIYVVNGKQLLVWCLKWRDDLSSVQFVARRIQNLPTKSWEARNPSLESTQKEARTAGLCFWRIRYHQLYVLWR